MKKEEKVVHLFVEQFDNGYSVIEKEDGAEVFAEVVEGASRRKARLNTFWLDFA